MRLALTAVALGAAAVLAGQVTAGEGPPLAHPSRIDPRVLADTADGKSAPFLVVLKEQADVSSAADTVRDRDALGQVVVDRLRDAARSQAPLRAELGRRGIAYRPFWVVNVIAVTGDRALVEDLAARSDVARIEPDRTFRGIEAESQSTPAGAAGPRAIEPGIQQINADDMWNLGFEGLHMVYANADTGVRWDHNALKSHYRGWNGATAVHDYNWHDAIHSGGGLTCGANTVAPCDDDIHGTHTMGTAVGDDAAGNQIGVAPDAKWIACRNMDEGNGTPSTYIECLQFFIAPTNLAGNAPDPNLRPHAVGNSYGCPPSEGCTAASLQTAVDNVRSAGVFMAVSAGNSGSACGTVSDPPAIYDSSITVGAVNSLDVIAGFSSRGPVLVDASNRPKPDLVAPGVGVRSSFPNTVSSYASLNGTSMAAPHVGGAVLLLWSAIPSLVRNVDQTETLLKQSAVHLTTATVCGAETPNATPNNTYGSGRIDVLAAYTAAGQPTVVSTVTAGNILVGEGTRRSIVANVTVRLSGPRPGGVLVSYRTANGTAKAPKDYVAVSGTLRFGDRETVKRVRIPIVRDAVKESDETFFLRLEKPSGGTIATPRVRITIRNDDGLKPAR